MLTMNELILGLNVANWLLNKYKHSQLKKALKNELSPYIETFSKAYSEFMESYYLVLGAIAVCRFFKPLVNGKEKADEYTKNLETTYSNFNAALLELLSQIKLHKERIKEYLDKKDMMLIDILLDSMTDDEVDLKKLYKSKLVMQTFIKSAMRRNAFEIHLNKGLQEFVRAENILMDHPSKEMMKDLERLFAMGYTDPYKLMRVIKTVVAEKETHSTH